MGTIRTSATVAKPPEAVWAVLADPSLGLRLFSGCTRSEMTSPPPLRRGSRFVLVRTVDGKTVEVEFDVAVFRPPKEIELAGEAQGFRVEYRYRLRPVGEGTGEGTKVDLECVVEGLGLAALMEGVVTEALRRADADHLERLRDALG